MAGVRFVKTPGFYCPEPMCGRLVVPNVRYRDSDGEEILATLQQLRNGNGRSGSFRCSMEHPRSWRLVEDRDLVPLVVYASMSKDLESRRILGKNLCGVDEMFPLWCTWLAELETRLKDRPSMLPSLLQKEIRLVWKSFERGKVDRGFRNGLEVVAAMGRSEEDRPGLVLDFLKNYPKGDE